MAKRKPKALIERILESANQTSVASAAKKWRVRKGQIYAWRKRFPDTTAVAKTMVASGQLRGRKKFPTFANTTPTPIQSSADLQADLKLPMDAQGNVYAPCPTDVPEHVIRLKRLEETNFLLVRKIALLNEIREIDNALLRV